MATRARKKAAAPAEVAPAASAAAAAPAAVDWAALPRLREVHLFGVRHHSPRTSAVLRRFLDAAAPTVVMIEAPRDAVHLLPHLVAADTEPPVAILGYRTDGTPRSVAYPLASYSPEYVAMRWAAAHGARVEFIDLSCGESLAERPGAGAGDDDLAGDGDGDDGASEDAGGGDDDAEAAPAPGDGEDDWARGLGFRSFEEMWEAYFEAPAHDQAGFMAAMLAWADLTRARWPVLHHQARDARMSRHVLAELTAGTPPARIAVVVGAAHAAAMLAGAVDPALEATLAAPVPSAVTLIPYSFPRLAAQTGYGAGNRAPRYYQKAHDAGCDYVRATLETLIEFAEHLRVRGFAASLADTIEAYRLAVALAGLRGKHAPGLDELREATVATMCRGDATHVDAFLWPTVVGKAVGRVAAALGRNSLQDEFWRQVAASRLPASDELERFTLKLGDPVQVDTSVFLHRLRVADVPYASYQGSQQLASAGPDPGEAAGGFAALARVREHWQAQWTPATDIALVERIVHGDSLEQVVARLLHDALAAARGAGDAAHALMEAVVAGAPGVVPEALAVTDRLAAADDDLASLARATRALAGLVSYGSSRGGDAGATEVIAALCARAFTRAVLRIAGACVGDDEAVAPAREAIRVLHEVALGGSAGAAHVDRELYLRTVRPLVDDEHLHGACAGQLAGLLYLAEQLGEDEVTALIERRVSDRAAPAAAAAFVEGFLSVNALVLVKNRHVVAALDRFIQGIAVDRFREVLPLLRRALAGLGPTERRYLVENLLGHRQLGAQPQAVAALAARDVAALTAASADLAAAMDDLDDLL